MSLEAILNFRLFLKYLSNIYVSYDFPHISQIHHILFIIIAPMICLRINKSELDCLNNGNLSNNYCSELNIFAPPTSDTHNSYAEILNHRLMILGGRAFGRLGYEWSRLVLDLLTTFYPFFSISFFGKGNIYSIPVALLYFIAAQVY